MSAISDIVLLCHHSDIPLVRRWIPIAGEPIDPLRSGVGGDKVFCDALFAWAKNYLDLEDFLECVGAISWLYPSSVMLLVRQEGEECPAVYRLGETEVYSHDDSIETLLPKGVHKLVKVVRARCG